MPPEPRDSHPFQRGHRQGRVRQRIPPRPRKHRKNTGRGLSNVTASRAAARLINSSRRVVQGLSRWFVQGATSNGCNKSLNCFSPKQLPVFLLLRHITACMTAWTVQRAG